MRRIGRLTALLLVIAVLTACAPAPAPSPTPGRVEYSRDPSGRDEVLRVFLPGSITEITPAALNTINRRVSELGFNIEFEFYKGSSENPWKSYTYTNVYMDYIRRNLDENSVYIYNRFSIDGNYVPDLYLDDLLGDYYDAAQFYAPDYAANPALERFNAPGTLTEMPLGLTAPRSGDLTVLLREEVAGEYGIKIRTASEFIALLLWMKEREPLTVPGVVCFDRASRNFPLDIFLPEKGYWSPGHELPFCLTVGDNAVVPFYTMDESRAALEDFARLQRDKLWDVIRNDNRVDYRGLTKYPAILLYTKTLFDNGIDSAWVGGERDAYADFDLSEYRAYILYNDTQPAIEWNCESSEYSAIAGKNADLSEFFRLIQWLEYEEHYNRLFYGIEGEDYRLHNGQMTPIGSAIEWRAARLALSPFQKDEFLAVIPFAPPNFVDELAAVTPPYSVSLDPRDGLFAVDYNCYLTSAEIGDISSAYSDTIAYVTDLVETPFGFKALPSETQVTQYMDEYLKTYTHNRVGALNVLSMQMAEAIENAQIHTPEAW